LLSGVPQHQLCISFSNLKYTTVHKKKQQEIKKIQQFKFTQKFLEKTSRKGTGAKA